MASSGVSVNGVCMMMGEGLSGTVGFTQPMSANGSTGPVTVYGAVKGLSEGNHQLHVCAFGDLTNGGTSCGATFNPKGASGGEGEEGFAGDVGLINVGADGAAEI